jgi:nitrogen fixation protein FixH
MNSRLLAVTVAVAALALCGAAAVATADGDSVKTKVKITEGGPTRFEGTVSSKEPACEKKRKVTLFNETQDLEYETTTDKDGFWEIDDSFIEGSYHAEAAKKHTRTANCRLGIGISHQF